MPPIGAPPKVSPIGSSPPAPKLRLSRSGRRRPERAIRRPPRREDPMTTIVRRSLKVAPAALLALGCWTSAAWAQGAIDKIANDDSIFIDGYTFQVRPGR